MISHKGQDFKPIKEFGKENLKSIKQAIKENMEFEIKQKRFKHKITGEIKTQLNIFELKDYEEIQE